MLSFFFFIFIYLFSFLGYLRFDLKTGKKQEWYAPLHTYCEEIVIVQKKKNISKSNELNDLKAEILNNDFKSKSNDLKKKVSKQNKNENDNKVEKEDEDDVWILGSMFDAVSNRASVGIFDGKDLSKGITSFLTYFLPSFLLSFLDFLH